MKICVKIAMVGLSMLVMAGCGRKSHNGPGAKPASSIVSTSPDVSSSIFAPACPAAPGKDAVRRAIKAAMTQIYGVDDAATRYAVTSLATTDCRHLIVTYRAIRAGSDSQKSPLAYGDDTKWNLELYGKHYPVE